MKLVILSEEKDRSSDIVCSWLQRYHVPYMRINSEQFMNPQMDIRINPEKSSAILFNGHQIADLAQTETVWFRRGYLYAYPLYYGKDMHSTATDELNRHLENESFTLQHFVYEILSSKKKINHPDTYNYNKLIALHEAAKVGFNIPDTLVSGNGNSLKRFVSEHNNCITKSIQDIFSFKIKGVFTTIGKIAPVDTEEITESSYWYSLFQNEIPKKYELRIFYFLGKMYAMAIFSQLDEESRLDFRDVDVNGLRPNRMVPFNLPKEIKRKIHKLMKKLNLESGSLDIIVTPDNDYYFLEVNPVGQFNFVSEVCNYHIEQQIAKHLAK